MRQTILLLIAAAVAGCAPARQYCADRGADLVDVVRLNVAYGPGLGATVFATTAVKLGAIGEHSRHVGLDGHGVGAWGQDRVDWHLLLAGYQYGHRNTPIHGSVETHAGSGGDYWLSPLLGATEHTQDRRHVCGPLEFGARVNVLLLGAETGLRLTELADLLAGVAGFDPKGDDGRTRGAL